MDNLAFAPQHNMVAYLEKTKSNVDFYKIVDFLTSSSIHHALTIYATVDGKTIVITESSVRRYLLFTDDNGITCLTNAQIFENFPLIGYEGSSLERQETMGGVTAQIRFESEPIQSSDPPLLTSNTVKSREDRMEHAIELMDPVTQTRYDSPLSGGQTPGSDEGNMTLKELTDLCTILSEKILHLENVKTAQEKEIASLKKRGRKNLKSQQKFQDIDDLVDEEVIVKDNSSGEKGGSTAKTVSTARPEVSTAEPKTPPTTTTLFYDEDVTIADTLSRSFEEIRKLYTKKQKWVDAFVPIGSEENEKRFRSRKKRAAGSSSKQKSPKKKKKVNDQEFIDTDKELRKWLKVVPDDDKAINYETLDDKSPIVDFLDRQDVLDLHKIVMERFPANDPEGYDLILWGDLKILMESNEDDEIWRNQKDWKLLSWKLYETCKVHTLMLDDSLASINMFVEKRYPLTKEILEKMLSWRLEAETKSTLALDLIKFIKL
uniref:Uncharacterized protein n=1 Tax=Tanacetum cinerariifolium TaxID=118510 RepID=A0A6L2KGR9_TANCI|nr:hypothetical protein [Tanacetum cinerariifolium]